MIFNLVLVLGIGLYLSNNSITTIIDTNKLHKSVNSTNSTPKGTIDDSIAPNKYFDDWDSADNATNWDFDTAGVISENQDDVTYNSSLYSCRLDWVSAGTTAYYSDEVTGLSTSALYHLGVNIYDNAAKIDILWRMEFYTSTSSTWGSFDAAYEDGIGFTDTAGWQYYEWNGEIDSTFTVARIGLLIGTQSSGSGQSVNIDDIYWYTESFLEFPSLNSTVILFSCVGLITCFLIMKKRI